jgi:hypothetical protein
VARDRTPGWAEFAADQLDGGGVNLAQSTLQTWNLGVRRETGSDRAVVVDQRQDVGVVSPVSVWPGGATTTGTTAGWDRFAIVSPSSRCIPSSTITWTSRDRHDRLLPGSSPSRWKSPSGG